MVSIAAVVQWNVNKTDYTVCGNVMISTPTCLVDMQEWPFWAFITPFVVYAALCALWLLLNSFLTTEDLQEAIEMENVLSQSQSQSQEVQLGAGWVQACQSAFNLESSFCGLPLP